MVLTMAPEAKTEGSTYHVRSIVFAMSLTNVTTYFLVHVGFQDGIFGNLLIFLQGFAKANQVENLGMKNKRIINEIQERTIIQIDWSRRFG